MGAEARSPTRACSTRATRSSRTARAAARRCRATRSRSATRTSWTRRVYVRLPVAEDGGPLQAGDELLVWTTTPWTLVSNAAVAVDPELIYVRAKAGTLDAPVVLAEALVERVLGDRRRADPRPLPRRRARRRALRAAVPVPRRPTSTASAATRVLLGRLRHRRRRHRPRAHGDRVRRGRLPPRRAVRPERRQPGAARRHVRRAHRPVRRALRQGRRRRPRSRTSRAAAGCCAPSDSSTPTRTAGAGATRCIYYAKPSWYIATSKLRDRLLAANEQVDWHPEHIKRRALRATGWRQRRLGAVARALLGHAAAGLALRGRAHVTSSAPSTSSRSCSGVRLEDPHRPYVDDVDVPVPASAASA